MTNKTTASSKSTAAKKTTSKARMARGEQGHSDDDWHKAVKELRKGKK